MADVFDKAKRSEVMSQIKGKGNKSTELKMIEIFRSNHITGWRRNQKLFGNPDFVFKKLKLVVFVDGCFWHGCPKHYNRPANNSEFWEKKYKANKKRDRKVNSTLKKEGWTVLRIWEHELKSEDSVAKKIFKIIDK